MYNLLIFMPLPVRLGSPEAWQLMQQHDFVMHVAIPGVILVLLAW